MLGGTHRHLENSIRSFQHCGRPVKDSYPASVAGQTRGILATRLYVKGEAQKIHQTLADAYDRPSLLSRCFHLAKPSTVMFARSNFAQYRRGG